MEYKKIADNQWIVILLKGDCIIKSLTDFAKSNNIFAAKLEGIDAINFCDVGYLDTDKQEYIRSEFTGHLELLSATGNITKLESGEPFVHIHISFSDEKYHAKGGHLFAANIAAVGEFFITTYPEAIERKFACDLGINAISLQEL